MEDNKGTKEIFFFKSHAKNESGKLVPDLLFFKKTLYEVKVSCQIVWSLVSIYLDSPKLAIQ